MTIPTFIDERQESDFWDQHEATDYLDDTEEVSFEFIDERHHHISIPFELTVMEKLQAIATQKGISSQALMRLWIMERLADEGMR